MITCICTVLSKMEYIDSIQNGRSTGMADVLVI